MPVVPQDSGNNATGLRVRSVDGTAYCIGGDSIGEYILHPVFLRFFGIAIVLFAVFDQTSALDGWALGLLWFAVGCLVLVWLVLGARLVVWLMRRGWIDRLYTPALLVPMVVGIELMLRAVLVVAGFATWPSTEELAQHVVRNLVVVLLFDIIHGSFVVHAHPLASAEGSARPEGRAARPLPVDDSERASDRDLGRDLGRVPDRIGERTAELAADRMALVSVAGLTTVPQPEAWEDGAMVQIGPVLMPMASILSIRTEDHYLGVTTRSGKALHRAKMADIPELHTGIAGMQINRSVWVAYAAIKEVVDAENRQVVVALVTGDEERVAKPRTFAFRQSYAKFLASRLAG